MRTLAPYGVFRPVTSTGSAQANHATLTVCEAYDSRSYGRGRRGFVINLCAALQGLPKVAPLTVKEAALQHNVVGPVDKGNLR